MDYIHNNVYMVQTQDKCSIESEENLKNMLKYIAETEKPVKTAIYRIISFGNIQPVRVEYVGSAMGYVEDKFGNLIFNF
jgi:hypothetical protein